MLWPSHKSLSELSETNRTPALPLSAPPHQNQHHQCHLHLQNILNITIDLHMPISLQAVKVSSPLTKCQTLPIPFPAFSSTHAIPLSPRSSFMAVETITLILAAVTTGNAISENYWTASIASACRKPIFPQL